MTGRDLPGYAVDDDTVIWRYMSRDRIRGLLGGHLYFAAAHQFDDAFEGAITDGAQRRRVAEAARLFPNDLDDQSHWLRQLSTAFEQLRHLTKINCWHMSRYENVAMWERYTRSSPAAVAVVSTVGALKRSLGEFRLQPTFGTETIYVGEVKYVDYLVEVGEGFMLEAFFRKRVEYRDEAEVRVALSLRMAEEFGVAVPADGVFVDVDVASLFSRVIASPWATATDVGILRDIVGAAGVPGAVGESALVRRPTY
ncbi:hypothetical protein [Jatrophihabitans lederbergiae]|uniref:DUF2971 domain-containing protein n=1 Tax=Jatrophihabitans lederbergiae TaxID=3075547 RepID=A0ABU2JI62_9ACTN|nr:hypothetical protein [Jatrophihabitans sp. DSM 44399]MDT0264184.1 hypothetical protein [Jatrophihabitans sp. DSM 44399]